MIGTRLGAYEITAKLGEGGMGEVWRARDAKLEREVAIKVLPAHLASDADALARFEREAKAVAALSHPNILAIFDFGTEGETAYAAMELLDGETVGKRLAGGKLPARKALEIAAQIASGLAAAHERGIVHRDLKPDNLFLTRDGQVKILDFGLARQAEAKDSKSQLFAAPTQGPGTAAGTVLGTVGYMSPEQVRGEPADHRSDLFSLGIVLYEMLAGWRAFERGSAVETMAAILKEDPRDFDTLAESQSPSVVRVLQHCLEKRPEERFQSARDLAFELRSLASGASTSSRSGRVDAVAAPRSRRGALVVAAVGFGGLALGWLLAAILARPGTIAGASAAPRPTFRQLTKVPGGEGSPTISPDGESLVFVKEDGGDLDLFVQRIDGAKAIPLTADCSKDDADPAYSPDGRSIAYRSECGGGIFVMGATGESGRRVTDFGFQPAWSPDGRELAVVTERLLSPTSRVSESELWAVGVESGARRKVSEHDAMSPTWSPDGKRIAFWGLKGDTFQRDLWSVAADGSESGRDAAFALLDDAAVDWAPVYSRDGRWLWFASTRGGTFNLWRLALDSATGKPQGAPEPLTAPSSWAGPLSLSADGRRIVFADRNIETEIVSATFDPRRGELAAPPVHRFSGSFEVRDQALSADGAWIAFTNEDPPQQIHLVRTDGTGYRQLTADGGRNRQGAWSPKGDWIVFQTTRGDSSLAAIRPDGGGWQPVPVGPGYSEPRVSPDGSTIAAFDTSKGGVRFDVRAGLGSPVARELPAVAPGELFWPAAWSPDGALLAGRSVRESVARSVVVHTIASGSFRRLAVELEADLAGTMAFLGSDRLVIPAGSALLLVELDSGVTKRLASAPPGHRFTNLSVAADGRTLTWIDRADESDIWLMTLDDAAGGAKASAGGSLP